MATRSDCDVVVVGAGPAGVSLAVALGQRGHRVMLVERSEAPRDKACGEGLMPLGANLLSGLGLELAGRGYPEVDGVRYRLADGRSVAGGFKAASGPGYGVRRSRFNGDLHELADGASGVELTTGCRALSVHSHPDHAEVETSLGTLRAGAVVAADGLASPTAAQLGWARPARPPHRYALVGHVQAPGHTQREICVTLLPGCEVYSAPTSAEEILVAVLGPRGRLVPPGRRVAGAYQSAIETAHPELSGAGFGRIRGAGPFRRRPSTVARQRVFLLGDAAGFIDPLTGDAMAAGVAAGVELARLLAADVESAASRYRAWHAHQWRRRSVVTALALFLTGGHRRAGRALEGIGRRPAALSSLLEVNGGLRELHQVPVRDYVSLAGI